MEEGGLTVEWRQRTVITARVAQGRSMWYHVVSSVSAHPIHAKRWPFLLTNLEILNWDPRTWRDHGQFISTQAEIRNRRPDFGGRRPRGEALGPKKGIRGLPAHRGLSRGRRRQGRLRARAEKHSAMSPSLQAFAWSFCELHRHGSVIIGDGHGERSCLQLLFKSTVNRY